MSDGLREKCDMYRRQLGGTNAALARARQEIKELKAANERLEAENEHLKDVNGALCAEINRQSDIIRRQRERLVLLEAFANEACAEFEATGRENVFCYERFVELAEGAGLEVPR